MTKSVSINLAEIGDIILNESSSADQLRQALDDFVLVSGEIGGVKSDPSFDAWATDTFLQSGVAINPAAAGHCARDYWRSVVFIRALYAAISDCLARFPQKPLVILYAGCGQVFGITAAPQPSSDLNLR